MDPSVNLGKYFIGASLLTDFNYREKLNIELEVKAKEPNWTVNPGAYDNTMNIIGTIKINGIFHQISGIKLLPMLVQRFGV